MRHPILARLAGALTALSGIAGSAVASYTQNFDAFPDGTTQLGDGTVISSAAAGGAGVQGSRLRLTRDGFASENAAFKIPGFPGAANGWRAEFDLTIIDADPGSNPADGVSFNWGAIPLDASLSANAGGAERGWTQSVNHVAFQVDTWMNGGGDNGLRIAGYPSGSEVVHAQAAGNILNDNTTVTGRVVVAWNPVDGASMTTSGFLTNVNFTGVVVPGLVPSDANAFAFAARTGGAHQTVLIDNLTISAAPGVGIATPDLAISEVVLDNTAFEDEHCRTPGWLELYNGTPAAIPLDGWSLTDDAAVPGKWAFPSGVTVPSYGHLVVHLGYGNQPPIRPDTRLHTNFEPVRTGGFIGLHRGATLVDSLTYPAQFEDVAYGRLGTAWTLGFLQNPTPGARNIGPQSAGGPIAEEVAWPQEGGLFSAPFALSLPAPTTPGAVIRYTLDNSVPTVSSTLYAAPLTVGGNTNIRAAVFAAGRLPGPVTSRTFLRLDASLTNYRGGGQPFQSNLPVIVLDSFGQSIDTTRTLTYTYGVVLAPDPAAGDRARLTPTAPVDFRGRGGTRLRGETSAGMPQKPYAWETWDNEGRDKAVSILGMPAESDWVLYAPATDKTLMRNLVVYNAMFALNGQGSAMRTRLVELFFNQRPGAASVTWEDYRGVYVLIERIKRDNDRVDIEEMTPCDTDPVTITGGYLFRKDKPSEDPTFATTSGQVLQLLEPETSVGSAQWTWLRDHMNAFETALNGAGFADPATGWRAYLDERSWQDNEWWVEAFKQIDGYRLSTYFHKDRGGRIRSAPVWDYNLSGGNADYLAGWNYRGWYRDAGISQGASGNTDFHYYWRLRQDPAYLRALWDRWWEIRRSVLATPALMARIDEAASVLAGGNPDRNITNGSGTWPASVPSVEVPAARHHARWQQLGRYDWPNAPGFGGRTRWSAATDAADYASLTATPYNVDAPPAMSERVHLKAFLTNRLAWIDDANITGGVILRPPVLSSGGGNVPAGFALAISPHAGTPPPAAGYGLSGTLTYASGPIHYTLDGTDPMGVTVPGTTRVLVADSGPAAFCVPASAAAGGDGAGRAWTDPDFTTTVWNAATNPNGWVSGLNGVGYDDGRTSGVNYMPLINTVLSTAQNPVAGMPTMRADTSPPGNQTCYIRLPFTLSAGDLVGLTGLKLHALSDDGFIAWLNGVRIGERNAPAGTPSWNTGVTAAFDDTAASTWTEIPVQNAATALAALRAGSNVLAVQGLNAFVTSSDFLQRFRLEAVTGGGVTGGGAVYTGPLSLTSSVTVKARQRHAATGAWTPLTSATFAVAAEPAGPSNLAVSEMMYHPVDPSSAEVAAGFTSANAFEYIEVMNIGNASVDLAGVVFSGAFSFAWPSDDPSLRVLPPGARAVIVGNAAAFQLRHAPGPAVRVAGVFDGNLANSGERIVIAGPAGPIRDFAWDDAAPWPVEADGGGFSLVLNHPRSNPDHGLPVNWRSSMEVGGTPGEAPGPAGPTGSAEAAGADSDGDGITDLVEFATGTLGLAGVTPVPLTASWRTEVLPPAFVPADYLTVSCRRSRSADGFSFAPEVATTLAAWQPLDTLFSLARQENNPDGTVTLTWRSNQPAADMPARLFFHLRVGLAP